MEEIGFSKGIWVGWKTSKVNLKVPEKNQLFIHLEIMEANQSKWRFWVVCANPNKDLKIEL